MMQRKQDYEIFDEIHESKIRAFALFLQCYIIFALLRERTEFLLSRHEPVSNRWRMNQDAYIRIRKPTSSS